MITRQPTKKASNGIWNTIYLALMKVLTWLLHFCSLLWQKNVTASQNVEVPDAKGSHPSAWSPTFLKLFSFWQIILQFGSLRQFFTSIMSQLHIHWQNIKNHISLNNNYILVYLCWMIRPSSITKTMHALEFQLELEEMKVSIFLTAKKTTINLHWGSNNATPEVSPK